MSEYHTTILIMLVLTVTISVLSTVAVIDQVEQMENQRQETIEAPMMERDVSTNSKSTALVVVSVRE
ncbi:hypothetical protein H6504_02060 [Candidatus Woesearchaeota archaeon]|nr:hypothetical protein [Candidatus Woesearchaeota archaeon]